MKKIIIEPYNDNWPTQYETESQLIQNALQKNLINIYHVGSTAVPGLYAKPKIDIIAVIKEPLKGIGALQSIGYTYSGEWNIPLKYGFTKRNGTKVNLHVYEEGHPEIELNLLFRDYLREHPEVREQYSQLKQQLVNEEKSHTREEGEFFYKYTLGKGNLIRAIIQKTGFNKLRILKASAPEEWNKIKELREAYYMNDNIKGCVTKDKNHTHLVLYQGVEMIGCANINFENDTKGKIIDIIVQSNLDVKVLESDFRQRIEHWLKQLESYKN